MAINVDQIPKDRSGLGSSLKLKDLDTVLNEAISQFETGAGEVPSAFRAPLDPYRDAYSTIVPKVDSPENQR